MLLNKGEYNGKRLLSRRTVELITSNQIGNLNLGTDKFGLGFEITTQAGQAVLGSLLKAPFRGEDILELHTGLIPKKSWYAFCLFSSFRLVTEK